MFQACCLVGPRLNRWVHTDMGQEEQDSPDKTRRKDYNFDDDQESLGSESAGPNQVVASIGLGKISHSV